MELSERQTIIFAILVLYLGKYLTSKIAFLREYNIPEPVSGGLIASILFGILYGHLTSSCSSIYSFETPC